MSCRVLPNQKGFSLVEVLIVICLMIILAALAVPALQTYAVNRNLRAAARDIASDIFELRERALGENVQYRMSFNIAANNQQYIIQRCDASGSNCSNIETKSLTRFANDIILTDAAFNTGADIRFQTRGTTSQGHISLANGRPTPSTATITTNITGRTSVQFAMH